MDEKLNNKNRALVKKLAGLISRNEKNPYILCGIYTGGCIIGQELIKHLKNVKQNKLYFIKLNKSKKYSLRETDLPKRISHLVTIVFLDDAIWSGKTKSTIDEFMKKRYPLNHYKFAVFLDGKGFADYAIY